MKNKDLDYALDKIEEFDRLINDIYYKLANTSGGTGSETPPSDNVAQDKRVLFYDKDSEDATYNLGYTSGIGIGTSLALKKTILGAYSEYDAFVIYFNCGTFKSHIIMNLNNLPKTSAYFSTVMSNREATNIFVPSFQIGSTKTSIGFLRTMLVNLSDLTNITITQMSDKTTYYIYRMVAIKK